MLGAVGELRKMGNNVEVNAQVSRQIGAALSILKRRRAAKLMRNDEVTFEGLLASHVAATAGRVRAETSQVLVIHDTTTCQFAHLDPEEIGYLQTGKAGFLLHLALVVDADVWRRPLGVMHAETIHRAERSRRGGRCRQAATSSSPT